MKVNAKSFPHPVLGNEDDIAGTFKVDFSYELGHDIIGLSTTFNLENSSIEELIKRDRASYILEIECRSTFFRTSLKTRTAIEKFELPSHLMRERVTAGFFVCAEESIKDYHPKGCHPDYGKTLFEIEPGDVLAVGGYCTFIAEKSFDPLRPPVSSFMSVVESSRHEGPMEIDYENPKITINLSKADYRNYVGLRGQQSTVGALHASVAFPVLVDAIYKVQQEAADYDDKNWFGRLQAILQARSLFEKEPFEAAQRILDNPVNRSFLGINSLLDSNGDTES